MTMLDSTSIPLVALMVFAVAALTGVLVRAARRRSRARRRLVEQPNSHYTSPLVKAVETRHRWQDMALDRIHEINREEVVRLLAKIEVSGVEALRTDERVFLDGIAILAGTPPRPEPREPVRSQATTELRHRPA